MLLDLSNSVLGCVYLYSIFSHQAVDPPRSELLRAFWRIRESKVFHGTMFHFHVSESECSVLMRFEMFYQMLCLALPLAS